MNSSQRARRRERRAYNRKQQQYDKLRKCFDYDYIFSVDNLVKAANTCKKGVLWKTSVIRFMKTTVRNCIELHNQLMNVGNDACMKKDKYIKQEPVHFILNERGKARHISAVRFRDRIVQRTLCDNSLVPLIQNQLINNNAASLKNKGTAFFRKQLRKDLLKAYNKYLAYLNNHDSNNVNNSNNANITDNNYDPWEAIFNADNTCNDPLMNAHSHICDYDSCKQDSHYSESDDDNKCPHASETNKNGALSEFHSKADKLYANMKSSSENEDFDPWASCFTDDCNNATTQPVIRTNKNSAKEKTYYSNHSNVNHDDNNKMLRINADNHEWTNPYIVIFDYSNYFGSIDSTSAYHKLYDYYMSFTPYMSRHESNDVRKLLETIRIFIEDEPHLGLGNQTSQTMAIWFTDRIDHLASKYGYYGRYMDDGYCICPDRMTADEFKTMLTQESNKLGLTLNPTKIKTIKLPCDEPLMNTFNACNIANKRTNSNGNNTIQADIVSTVANSNAYNKKSNKHNKNTVNASNNGYHRFTILKRDYWFDNQHRLNIMMTRKSLKWNKHHTGNVIKHSNGVNIPIRILISILLNMKANADMLTHKHGFINDYNKWFNRMASNHGFSIDMKNTSQKHRKTSQK